MNTQTALRIVLKSGQQIVVTGDPKEREYVERFLTSWYQINKVIRIGDTSATVLPWAVNIEDIASIQVVSVVPQQETQPSNWSQGFIGPKSGPH